MDFQMVNAFLQIPYGIFVLATNHDFRPQAMVVSWACQVSYSPPLIMVALRHNRPAIPAIRDQGFFSLNLLRAEQRDLVNRFKNPVLSSADALLFTHTRGRTKIFHHLKDSLASWECQVVSQLQPGDHLLLVSQVLTASAKQGTPLITSQFGKTYIGEA
jgi:flavin reductase (DIM6/NTAB) family NADH-FMN oxidoreductase RutF